MKNPHDLLGVLSSQLDRTGLGLLHHKPILSPICTDVPPATENVRRPSKDGGVLAAIRAELKHELSSPLSSPPPFSSEVTHRYLLAHRFVNPNPNPQPQRRQSHLSFPPPVRRMRRTSPPCRTRRRRRTCSCAAGLVPRRSSSRRCSPRCSLPTRSRCPGRPS
jgi:hypothetical protein